MKNNIVQSIRLAVGSACIMYSGLYFAKAIYYKGKQDAFIEVQDEVNKIARDLKLKSIMEKEES